MTIFAPAARRGLFVDWAFFDGSEISSEFVGGQCASWRFPPKAAVSACSRHSFVEGIRNGGLDVLKTAAVPGKSILGAQSCLPCNGFFFPRLAGQDRLAYSVLVLLLIGCLFQPIKTLIADDVFNTTGIGLRSLGSTPAVISCSVKKQ